MDDCCDADRCNEHDGYRLPMAREGLESLTEMDRQVREGRMRETKARSANEILVQMLGKDGAKDAYTLFQDERGKWEAVPDAESLIERVTFEQTVDAVLSDAFDLIVRRQRTYGPTNIADQGIFGVVQRIGLDKLARIRQRLNGKVVGGKVVLDPIELGTVDEPGIINDLFDVIGYAVCGILELKGEWGKPLSDES